MWLKGTYIVWYAVVVTVIFLMNLVDLCYLLIHVLLNAWIHVRLIYCVLVLPTLMQTTQGSQIDLIFEYTNLIYHLIDFITFIRYTSYGCLV